MSDTITEVQRHFEGDEVITTCIKCIKYLHCMMIELCCKNILNEN